MTDVAITPDVAAPEGFRASLKRFGVAGTIAFLLIFAASLVRAYFTYTLGLVCISYSTSASASAVLSWIHQ